MPCSVPQGLSCLSIPSCTKGLRSQRSGHRDFTFPLSLPSPLTSGVISASFGGQSTTLSSLDVQAMLPENLSHFYRYQGSLTTPPCSESVIWTIFHSPIVLSHTQVSSQHLLLPSNISLCAQQSSQSSLMLWEGWGRGDGMGAGQWDGAWPDDIRVTWTRTQNHMMPGGHMIRKSWVM